MTGSEPELPAGVARETAAPQRVVIVWSAADLPEVFAALTAAGALALRLHPGDTEDFVATSGLPAAVLVDPRCLDDAATEVLDRLRGGRARLRIAVLAGGASDAAALLAALRAGLTDLVDPADPAALAAWHPGGAGLERVLAVGAHPDDVEIGCGATLLRHAGAADPVTVLTLSRGAVGGDRERRRGEAVAAAVALSAQLLMGDLPDTRMADAHEMIGIIEDVIAATAPTTVYIHSGADNHQDHRAVHRAAVIAARRVPRVFCYQSPSARNGFAPTKFIPVEATLTGKLEVLACYRSQSTRHYLDPELVVATARYWARQLPGTRYAEPFEVVRDTELS